MAARSLGRGVGRLLGSLRGLSGQPARPLCRVSAPLRAASGPSGSAPAVAAASQPSSYPALSAQAAREPAAFWGPLARDTLVWDTPYHTVWDCDFSTGKIGWFLGGQLNVSGEWASGDPGRPQLLRPEGTRSLSPAAAVPGLRGSHPCRGPSSSIPSAPPALSSGSTSPCPSSHPAPDPRAQLGPVPAGTRWPLGTPRCWPCSARLLALLTPELRYRVHSAAEPEPAGSRGLHPSALVLGLSRCYTGVDGKTKQWRLSLGAAVPGDQPEDKPCPHKQTELWRATWGGGNPAWQLEPVISSLRAWGLWAGRK